MSFVLFIRLSIKGTSGLKLVFQASQMNDWELSRKLCGIINSRPNLGTRACGIYIAQSTEEEENKDKDPIVCNIRGPRLVTKTFKTKKKRVSCD